MTQGQRIRFVREFRHMTQKELGLACGFPKASADVRIRQYESDQKSPKKDALELIAAALKVNIYSLKTSFGWKLSVFWSCSSLSRYVNRMRIGLSEAPTTSQTISNTMRPSESL